MKLNIGSSEPRGQYAKEEWLNIDASRYFRAAKTRTGKQLRNFVLADGSKMPFRAGAFDLVHAVHVLEHMPRTEHLSFLKELRRVLSPVGAGFIEVPDFIQVCTILATANALLHQTTLKEAEVAHLRELIRQRTVGVYGKGRHEGDFHHWGFSSWHLEALCQEAGLHYTRETEMISNHHRMEPVLLYRVRPS